MDSLRTADEVVAYNVKRIREEKGLSRAELAERLSIGQHVVRDYERPRKGQPQREFTWTEIMDLCIVLHVTLFDLVLPPAGVSLHPQGGDKPGDKAAWAEAARRVGADDLAEHLVPSELRSWFGEILFGKRNLDPKLLEAHLEEQREKQLEKLGKLFGSFLHDASNDQLAAFNEVLDEFKAMRERE